MCIAVLSTAHPDYALIVISNRDEFIDRPTAHAHWWDDPNQHVLGGRDLERKERGTWLAITKQGRLAVLTNFREEGKEVTRAKSRGGIVNAFLMPSGDRRDSPREYARRLIEDIGVDDVGGFSLIFGDLKASMGEDDNSSLFVLSNRSASADSLERIVPNSGETRGLSNTHFTDLSWPKIIQGEQLLKDAIAKNVERHESQSQLIDECFGILSRDTIPRLPPSQPWETYTRQMRNSILIPPIDQQGVVYDSFDHVGNVSANGTHEVRDTKLQPTEHIYGTQKQTVILVDLNGKVVFVERTLFDKATRKTPDDQKQFEFSIDDWGSS